MTSIPQRARTLCFIPAQLVTRMGGWHQPPEEPPSVLQRHGPAPNRDDRPRWGCGNKRLPGDSARAAGRRGWLGFNRTPRATCSTDGLRPGTTAGARANATGTGIRWAQSDRPSAPEEGLNFSRRVEAVRDWPEVVTRWRRQPWLGALESLLSVRCWVWP